jgi:hypothetical protein
MRRISIEQGEKKEKQFGSLYYFTLFTFLAELGASTKTKARKNKTRN